MAKIDYYKCDRCGSEGNEKFSHVSWYGRQNGDCDLCNHCMMAMERMTRPDPVEVEVPRAEVSGSTEDIPF